eukprot:Platyproteum_vivax@DN3891_c0_g1_i2.p1
MPSTTWRVRKEVQNNGKSEMVWADLKSSEIFDGRRVVVFALPGAYTPTCSSAHLPDYNMKALKIKTDFKVDEVYCLSVNDAFVMNAWKKDQKADNIEVIPDGNGEFTSKMGMLVSKSNLGFGM